MTDRTPRTEARLREAAQRLVDVIFAEAQSEPFVLPLRGMRAANDLRAALATPPDPEPTTEAAWEARVIAAATDGGNGDAVVSLDDALYFVRHAIRAEGLDVEALVQALRPVTRYLAIAGGDKGYDRWLTETASAIAAEYAALTRSEP
jgi:hypothetical protein